MSTEPMVRSIDAAMNWFLENSMGRVLCVADDNEERYCETFDEARVFFVEHNRD